MNLEPNLGEQATVTCKMIGGRQAVITVFHQDPAEDDVAPRTGTHAGTRTSG